VVRVGIDEAGLGPLLGSLAIGYAALEVPTGECEPWKSLRGTVTRSPRGKARLMVADSKLVFQRNAKGARRLEATVLAFLAQARGGSLLAEPEAFLFGALAPPPEHRSLPWGGDLPRLPWAAEPEGLELSSALLQRALRRSGLELLELGVRLVPASELNASFLATGNKADSVWALVLEVLRHAWELRRRAPVEVTVDMLGGRRHYGPLLGRAFPQARVTLDSERAGRSAYRLAARDGSGTLALEFRVKGDRDSFVTALASCAAKYARETEMRAFNAFFARLQPDLVPTAGYRGDGSRWLREADAALRRSGLARECLVRTR
jgi:hypothetical protein